MKITYQHKNTTLTVERKGKDICPKEQAELFDRLANGSTSLRATIEYDNGEIIRTTLGALLTMTSGLTNPALN